MKEPIAKQCYCLKMIDKGLIPDLHIKGQASIPLSEHILCSIVGLKPFMA
jgi:hypothetical protein